MFPWTKVTKKFEIRGKTKFTVSKGASAEMLWYIVGHSCSKGG